MDDTLSDAVISDARLKMARGVEHAQADFSTVRTGRASPALIEGLKVDYYGSEVPLKQIAGFSVPEARMLVVSPFDKSSLKSIEKAIMNSDLGINPSNDGIIIRLAFPPLTAERRQEFVKMVRSKAEEARIAIRSIRRAARQELEALEKAGDISSDELERAEKDLEKITQDHVSGIDTHLQHKEQELTEV
jgi:ribosome recycling factor